jgi:hypothetical protein
MHGHFGRGSDLVCVSLTSCTVTLPDPIAKPRLVLISLSFLPHSLLQFTQVKGLRTSPPITYLSLFFVIETSCTSFFPWSLSAIDIPSIQPYPTAVTSSCLAVYTSMSLGNISTSANDTRYQPSREEWMELKPTIWQLFIEEDRNLQHVVGLLRERQGLVLTYVCP